MLTPRDIKKMIRRIEKKDLLKSSLCYCCDRKSCSISEVIKTQEKFKKSTDCVLYVKMWFAWTNYTKGQKTEIVDNFFKGDVTMSKHIANTFLTNINDDKMTNSLYYEEFVYNYITTNIIMKKISPNFIPILKSEKTTIENIIKTLESSNAFVNKDKLLEKLENIQEMFPGITTNFITTGSSPDMISAHKFILEIDNETPQYEYHSIMFQFFHIFYVLHIYKIVHNDNHMSNFLIQTLPEEITLDFTINNFNVKFSTRYIVKIFDWDRSYCEFIGKNSILKDYFYIRLVDQFVPGRDFSTTIGCFYDYDVYQFNQILNRIIDGPKPSIDSNSHKTVLVNGVTPDLKKWIDNNPESIVTDSDGDKFMTVPKSVLDSLPESISAAIRDKLGTDQNDVCIYDGVNVTNIYLQFTDKDLIILSGFSCYPMYDSDDLNVEKYFTVDEKFDALCLGLVVNNTDQTYKYKLKS